MFEIELAEVAIYQSDHAMVVRHSHDKYIGRSFEAEQASGRTACLC